MTRDRDDGAASDAELIVAGDLRLEMGTREFRSGVRRVELEPDLAQLLRLLMQERGRVVTRTSLMIAMLGFASSERAAWLEERVNALRAATGDAVHIETVTGIGYRLI